MKLEGHSCNGNPFTTEDKVNEEGMQENMNYLLERGVNGLLAAGTHPGICHHNSPGTEEDDGDIGG